MSDNKFIKHLKGENTAKSLLEVRNQNTPTSFANMPEGTSNANDVYSDHRGNATAVLKGTDNWKLNDNTLTFATTVYGDGRDFTDEYSVGGAGLWVNAVYTFTDSKIFMPNTKWVLKLCGNRLFTESHEPIALTLLIKFGTSTLISKTFFVRENSFNFSEELVIDFDESVSTPIKVVVGDTMTIQVLCGDATAQAEIYNGMTVLTALQRKVDGEAIASDTRTFGDIENELEDIHDDIDDLKDYTDETFVRLDGNSIMTGPLKMRASISFECAIAPYWHGVGFYKLNDDNSVTLLASMEADDGFCPYGSNKYNIGSNYHKWKNLYLAGKAFVATINNGGDLAVPANTTGTLATKADVDLAANSGRMITDQGVWYAKMYAATVAPSAENGTNYADFSQTDGQGNPIIVIYERQNGAWVQSETITPPAEYDGYVPITSKIWDIAEQAGQQGGRILWNHQSKEFTPYPQIISFEDIEITGDSTVIMPQNPSTNQIVNKDYVDEAVANSGTGRNIGDVFFTMRNDNELNGAVECNGATYNTTDFAGAKNIGQLLEDGKIPYLSLADYATALTNDGVVGVFGWDGAGTTSFRVPSLSDIFIETGTAAQIGDYLEPAIPNIKYSIRYPTIGSSNGALTLGSRDSSYVGPASSNNVYFYPNNVDASTVSSVYKDTADTVQPKSVRYRAMVQLAVSATDEAVETCTSVLADVATLKGYDYVVDFQAPTADNGYTWYRKYKSGWVEQGGQTTSSSSGPSTITLPVVMSSAYYNTSITTAQLGNWFAFCAPTSTSQITIRVTSGTDQMPTAKNVSWEVKGMASS